MAQNKIFDRELCLVFLASDMQWRRVLYMAEGCYVEVDLTPRNYPKATQIHWEIVARAHFRLHHHARGPGDRQYRAVTDHSIIYGTVVTNMMKGGMLMPDIEALLKTDYQPLVDMRELRNRFTAFFSEIERKAA